MEFKRLSDVEIVESPTDNANILIEDNGIIKKAPKTFIGNFIIINNPNTIEEATCNKTYNEVIRMYCDSTIDCAIIKDIHGNGSFSFTMVDQISLLDSTGGISNISDAASAECISFYCQGGFTVYYYKDGLSLDPPVRVT